MDLRLSPYIHHAFADGRNIFLDVARDRYFGLSEQSERAFERYHTGATLSAEDRATLLRLKDIGLLIAEPSSSAPKEAPPTRQRSALDDEDTAPIGKWLVGDAVVRIVAAKRLQRRSSLGEILRNVKHHAVADHDPFDPAKLRLYARAFQQAAFLTRTRDQCLPCSVALTICLRRKNIPAHLIMGVSGRPFAAHCWVQVGDVVVNDTLDHVSLFAPILVQ